jgi:DNA-binding transcriptional ArsR family regulator
MSVTQTRPEPLDRQARVFAALGDSTRLALVSRLSAGGPASIARLASGAGVTRQAVSKHLRVLAEADLAHGARSGRELIWQLEPRQLDHARAFLDDIEAQWDRALGRLKALVESAP